MERVGGEDITNAGEEVVDDLLRSRYEQLKKAIRAQMNHLVEKRNVEKEVAYLMTSGQVILYNCVHQLVESLRPEILRNDICSENGGITCTNPMHVSLRLSGGPADYLSSRVVSLLDRSIDIGDKKSTLNVDYKSAADVRQLLLLFSERYRMCREKRKRLNHELDRLQQDDVVNVEKRITTLGDTTSRVLQTKIELFEIGLRAARAQLERIQDVCEESGQRCTKMLVGLSKLPGLYEPVVGILRNLCDNLQVEYDRVAHILGKLQHEGTSLAVDFANCEEERKLCVNDLTELHQQLAGCLARAELNIAGNIDVAACERELARGIQDLENGLNNFNQRKVNDNEFLSVEIQDRVQTLLSERTWDTLASFRKQLESGMEMEINRQVEDAIREVQGKLNDENNKRRELLYKQMKDELARREVEIMLDITKPSKPVDTDLGPYQSPYDKIKSLADFSKYPPSLDNVKRMKLPGVPNEYKEIKVEYNKLRSILEKLYGMVRFATLQASYMILLRMSEKDEGLGMGEKAEYVFVKNSWDELMDDGPHESKINMAVKKSLNELIDDTPNLLEGIKELYKRLGNDGNILLAKRNELQTIKIEHEKNFSTVRNLQFEFDEMRRRYNPDHRWIEKNNERQNIFDSVYKERMHVVEEMKNFGLRIHEEYKHWYKKTAGENAEMPPVLGFFVNIISM